MPAKINNNLNKLLVGLGLVAILVAVLVAVDVWQKNLIN